MWELGRLCPDGCECMVVERIRVHCQHHLIDLGTRIPKALTLLFLKFALPLKSFFFLLLSSEFLHLPVSHGLTLTLAICGSVCYKSFYCLLLLCPKTSSWSLKYISSNKMEVATNILSWLVRGLANITNPFNDNIKGGQRFPSCHTVTIEVCRMLRHSSLWLKCYNVFFQEKTRLAGAKGVISPEAS